MNPTINSTPLQQGGFCNSALAVKSCGYLPILTDFPEAFPKAASWDCIGSLRLVCPADSILIRSFMPKKAHNAGQIVLFPVSPTETGNLQDELRVSASRSGAAALAIKQPLTDPHLTQYQVVLSGSYRKDFETLRATYDELRDLGCQVLSPSNVVPVRETDGFVYMKGEESQSPDIIEGRHLDAIQKANFVWLHAPEGYIGPTASLEIGFARAIGVPVFAGEAVRDRVIQSFVETISSPAAAIEAIKNHSSPVPRPALVAFQQYYRRVAIQRGYNSESPKDCLLLMIEEVGELAREIRRRERLVRHGPSSDSTESKELADIFLYVVHMANVLDIDLSRVVQEKELINLQRFLKR